MTSNIAMERIIKTEMQPDGQVLLYYLDENGSTEQGILSTMESEEDGQTQNYTIVEEIDESMIQYEVDGQEEATEQEHESGPTDTWYDEEVRRALIFYTDNRETFLAGLTKQSHLWHVACKTMLPHKTPAACEAKIQSLKEKYVEMRLGGSTDRPFFELCHQAFHGDKYVEQLLQAKKNKSMQHHNADIINNASAQEPAYEVSFQPGNGVLTINPKKNHKFPADPKVERMLRIYLSCKRAAPKMNERWQKTIFQKIAVELGDDPDFWRKRFLNYKQHYIKLVEKNQANSLTQIDTTWPYLQIFQQIFEGDKEFHKKYATVTVETPVLEVPLDTPGIENFEANEDRGWNSTELTVLVKYYFDSFNEFNDPTIPKDYLWGEIGRLLDKKPEECQEKYEELKSLHLDQYDNGTYNLQNRNPKAIIFDNIIHREIKNELADSSKIPDCIVAWSVEQIDAMVQLYYDNLEMFKDSLCNNVCLAAVSRKLNEPVQDCRIQWQELVELYKSILNDKKENPDMQIDWRYTDMFDRIFDYGMDTQLMDDAFDKKSTEETHQNGDGSVADEEDYHDNSYTKTDPKLLMILQYYLKHKNIFAGKTVRKTHWEGIAKEIGLSLEQCSSRFKNLKQLYTAYVQKEINKPDKPILWPYYELCKKAFGYRVVKNQMKGKSDTYVSGEWQPKEIKTLIRHYSNQYNPKNGVEDKIDWSEVSKELRRSETACRDKFFDLRKSYRQIRTMVDRGGGCKISWKYYYLFDAIYSPRITSNEVVVPDQEIPSNIDSNSDPDNAEINTNSEVINTDEFSNTEVLSTETQPNIEVITAEAISNAEVIVPDMDINSVEENVAAIVGEKVITVELQSENTDFEMEIDGMVGGKVEYDAANENVTQESQ